MTKQEFLKNFDLKDDELSKEIFSSLSLAYDKGYEEGMKNGLNIATKIQDQVFSNLYKQ